MSAAALTIEQGEDWTAVVVLYELDPAYVGTPDDDYTGAE